MNSALTLTLRIAEEERIPRHAAHQTPAHNRASLIAPKDVRPSLHQVQQRSSADDTNRSCRSHTKGQAVEIHVRIMPRATC